MMRTAVKVIIIILIAQLTIFIAAAAAYLTITNGVELQPEKLYDASKTITVFDIDLNEVEGTEAFYGYGGVKVADLNSQTINAFIASEDRSFFKHSGLNYKRIIKSIFTNITSHSFKQGASTISQQLIKNTHLSSDKTISRKLKEIKLTKMLEKNYTKEEILEMYLNTIYFGHSCYGLESAAEFYFGVNAKDLNLEQSATIVGLLTSPNNYSPFKNPEQCIIKRNTVLKAMRDCGYITDEIYKNAITLQLSAQHNNKNNENLSYLKAVFNEMDECDIEPYGDYSNLKIETYLKQDEQKALNNLTFTYDGAVIITDLKGGVTAYRSCDDNLKRQIGSTAKPIFVYGPALEENKINSFTIIKDEKINYNGYSPENYDKKYHGNVSVEESIMYSYNIPAVKTLNSLTVDTAAKYAEKMDINLTDEDKNLSLALGGTASGMSIKQLCDCYGVVVNGGNFTPSKFIKRITDENGNVLYENKTDERKVFSTSTCSIMNDILIKTAKTGTAKKLKDIGFDVACKTGTCGDLQGNTDAYSVLYTSDRCMAVWAGSKNNEKLQITGGGYCCNQARELLAAIYKDRTPTNLDITSGVKAIEIDKDDYLESGKVMLCDSACPKLNRLKVLCREENLPTETSAKFTHPKIIKPTIAVNDNRINIQLCQTKYYEYQVIRQNNSTVETIYNGKWIDAIIDSPDNGEYEYSVIPYYRDGDIVYYGDKITFPKVLIGSENSAKEEIPDIANTEWYLR